MGSGKGRLREGTDKKKIESRYSLFFFSPCLRFSLCVLYFSVLVGRANKWLSQFVEFKVLCCETVEKKVLYVKDIYNSSMYFTDEDGPTLATDVKGLR